MRRRTRLSFPTLLVAALATLVCARPASAQPMPPQPPPGARPLGMRDLAATSSVGVETAAALVLGFDEPVGVFAVDLDGEIALGSYAKLFTSFPIVARLGFGDASVGIGNFALGALAMSGDAWTPWRVGGGASAGYGASDDGQYGLLLRFDTPSYGRGEPVVQAFVAGRGERDGAFAQLVIDESFWHEPDGDTTSLAVRVDRARLGGGWRVQALWLLATAEVAHEVDRDEAGDESGAFVTGLSLGVRGRFVAGPQTWCLRAGVAHFDAYTSLNIGIEVRTW